jgi:hypothetical protein
MESNTAWESSAGWMVSITKEDGKRVYFMAKVST